MINKIKEYVISKDFLLKLIFILGIIFLFYTFDIYLRYITITIDAFYSGRAIVPNLLTIIFICYFFPLFFIKSKMGSRIILIIFYVLGLVYFIVNYMMLKIKFIPMDFYNLHNASEGLTYVNTIFEHINKPFIIFILLTLILFLILFFIRGKITFNYSKKVYFIYPIIYVILIIGNIVSINSLYLDVDDWQNITSPRYYYDNFINSKRSAEIIGYYQYSVRDAYLYMKENYLTNYSNDDVEKLMSELSDTNIEDNEYTGIFKDKNLIMIMMESIDNVVVDKRTMPTLYKMRKDGWNFTERYSALSTGGSTIATEFTSLTGLMYNNAYYRINNNIYNESIPSVFKDNGYVTSFVHENNGVYYNREELHRNIGFDNTYFLYDMLDPYEYYVDAQMVTNDEVYNRIIPKDSDSPFMTMMVTIAGHGPYVDNGVCNEDEKAATSDIECFRYLAKRTDDLLDSLLKRLEEDGMLDDTVIVMYTDHQAYLYDYTLEDLKMFNKVDDEFNIKQLPFIIYSTDIKSKKIDTLFNDIDMVPTIFNLFGIDYDENSYVGRDIFSSNHDNVIMFNDGSWYDGNIYSLNDGIDRNDVYYKEVSDKVMNRIRLNDMLINTNYYG